MKVLTHLRFLISVVALSISGYAALAQNDAVASAKVDALQLIVGDQLRMFVEVKHNNTQSKITWTALPDSFNHLEVVERGKIDTFVQGANVTYKQRIVITGFDSGSFVIPPLSFQVTPQSGDPYAVATDSFRILVQTVPVDTTKPFKGIKNIFLVKGSWLDYLMYIIAGIILIILAVVTTRYFMKNKKVAPPRPSAPKESLHDKTIRLLRELEEQKLWQSGKIKEYYTQLTDIVRIYIEERFNTAAMELTTDELLHKARMRADMQPYFPQLTQVLQMADLAKFAKAEPLPEEHTAAMASAIAFVTSSKQTVTETLS
jgi:hypothetical protein